MLFVIVAYFCVKIWRLLYNQSVYKELKGKIKHVPEEKWRNNYPIVLLTGLAGSAPDLSLIYGENMSLLTKLTTNSTNDVYIAYTNPYASIHDRACEVYQ